MKQIIYTITISTLLLASSCKNIEKMVDKGNYDEAITYAVNKLEGKKDKKTKYVKALERAYDKINAQDIATIDRLHVSNRHDKYDKIYNMYLRMDERQKTVFRLDPLQSKDGYRPTLSRVDYTVLLSNTADLASESYYQEAIRLLTIAESTDKYAARQAYKSLSAIERYHHNYKNTDKLYDKAYEIGVDHIGLNIKVNAIGPQRDVLSDIIHQIDISALNTFWSQYHVGKLNGLQLDYIATVELSDVQPGFEREVYNTYLEYTDVEDGVTEVIDLDGNTVRDTSGNIIYTQRYRRVEAEISEVQREKIASITGKTVIYDARTSSLVKSIPISVTHQFDDYSSVYRGDERALTSKTRRKLKSRINTFPNDYEMVMAMTADLRETAFDILRSDIR